MVFVAGKTVWSMPERFKVVCIPCKALYKCLALLYFTLQQMQSADTWWCQVSSVSWPVPRRACRRRSCWAGEWDRCRATLWGRRGRRTRTVPECRRTRWTPCHVGRGTFAWRSPRLASLLHDFTHTYIHTLAITQIVVAHCCNHSEVLYVRAIQIFSLLLLLLVCYSHFVVQAVTKHLYFFVAVFSPIPSVPLLSPLYPSLSLPQSGSSNPAKRYRGVLLAPPAGNNNICSYQTRSLGSKYTKNAFVAEPGILGVFRTQRTCVVAANIVLYLLNDI